MSESGSQDMIEMLVADHRSVESAFREYESRQGGNEHRRDLLEHIISELVRHSVAEEHYLYPAARQFLSDGDELADHELAEHTAAEQLMSRLESMSADDAQREHTARQLFSSIRHHISDEENDLFPKLRASCSADTLADLGRKIQQAKDVAPTRPHPSAPDQPPANKILDRGAGLVDRLRDALTGRAQ